MSRMLRLALLLLEGWMDRFGLYNEYTVKKPIVLENKHQKLLINNAHISIFFSTMMTDQCMFNTRAVNVCFMSYEHHCTVSKVRILALACTLVNSSQPSSNVTVLC